MYIIFGYGKTGQGVAEFFLKKGIRYFIYTDDINNEEIQDFAITQLPSDITNIKAVVVSPGISTKYNVKSSFIEEIKQCGLPIISDIQLFMEMFPEKKYIGITGTNGKSTTATLVYEIYRQAGFNVALSGNIGISPFQSAIDCDICVLEISSFQLEVTNNIKFDISLIINITPDHLDRYHTFENYCKEKLRIVELSKQCVINETLPCNDYNNAILFSTEKAIEGYYLKKSSIYLNNKELSNISKALNLHNAENILGAFTIAHLFGIDINAIVKAIVEFKTIEHRLEFVCEKNSIKYYNDSKATNLSSTYNALKMLKGNIFLIAGGELFEDIFGIFARKEFELVKMIALIGTSAGKIKKALQEHNACSKNKIKYFLCGNLVSAVKILTVEAQKYTDSIILLSPFCKSFDQFSNFEERGKKFKEVLSLLQ